MSDLTFEAKAAVSGQQLVLGYRVTNRSRRDVYLLNRLYRSTPAWRMSPDIAFVEFDQPAATVRVSKRIPFLPAGVKAASPYIPFVTPIRAQQSFSEIIRLALPLEEFKQFGNVPPPEGAKKTLISFERVGLSIEYYWRAPGASEDELVAQETEVIVPRIPAGAGIESDLLHSPAFTVRVDGIAFVRPR